MGRNPVLLSLILNFSLLFAQPIPLCTNNGLAGPGTCADNVLARYDGTNSHILQCSDILVDDAENVSGVNTLTVTALTTDRAVYSDSGDALTSSATTSTQLAYLSNFSSALSANGDLYYHNGTNVTRIARGTDDQVLRSTATSIAWETMSSGGNSFETITPTAGTTPVADSATDTLTITSTGGSIVASGNSATDTIDFSVRYSNPTNDSDNECFGASSTCGAGSSGFNVAFGNATAGDSDSGSSTAIGNGASCTGSDSFCGGRAATSTFDNSVVIGSNQVGGAASTVNIGSLNTCTGDVCLGTDSDGQGASAIAIGNQCDIEADTGSGICIGKSATVGDGGSAVGFGIAIGDSAVVGWGYGIAIGRAANCSHASTCINRNATSTAHGQVVLGGNSNPMNDLIIGEGVTDATSTPITISNSERTGTNVTGNSMSFKTRGTGTGVSGEYLFKGHGAAASSSTAGTIVTLSTIGPNGNVIDGVTDNIQLRIQGHSTQTSAPFVVEKSDGTDIISTTNLGVFYVLPQATAPAACVIGDHYVDTSGAYCACTSTNTWSNMTTLVGSCV